VLLLLEQALAAQAGHRLVQRFNASTGQTTTAVARFARHLLTAAPVVAVESAIAFVEEEIAEIVTGHAEGGTPRIERGQPEGGDDTRLKVGVPSGNAIVLISCHSYRGIVDVTRVAHEIGSREVTGLIGCERFSDVPEALRGITDLRLTLPGMTPALFETWFTQVMGGAPPADWMVAGTAWVTHVRSTDLQQPRHLELSPDEAFAYVRDTVQERLRTVDPVRGLGLADLHGLGEARRFAEDLIADIHAAIAGRLPWAEVDRGVLLVGPPGTGKTTLARAIAKDCGVKFISASAASWQASGHLGDHIRAIRADFAQARRHAPAILFIDEIDSVGNRERFTGQNAQYNTEVVNAVLEQMQGLDPAAPVIVIAATNHADRVDAALRRAGRLDRIIEISRPGVDALTAIYQHYLSPHAAAGALASDVAPELLAQLSLGLTGADVELMVRGAARRARKAGRPLGQADLIAEVTGLPRDGAVSPRLTPDEVQRVSVHEAGHALARCLSLTKGQDITFVSILPRPDGRLGFVAFAPPGGSLMTRREYLEKLEVTLAGRAAEEIEFGEEGVTGGAGGETSSDLAVATRIALALVMQYGLGMEKTLLWSETATPAQTAHAERVLANAYASVVGKLRANQPRLRALAEALRQRQELTGAELRAVVGA
jgi:AAA+ superfamily predicted ATPase